MSNGLLIKNINNYIRIDEDKKSLLIYDLKNGVVDPKTEAFLSEVSTELYMTIREELLIDPSEYGVKEATDREVIFR